MKQAGSSLLVRLFPSLTDVAFLMPLVFLFARLEGARTLLGDGDTGWHLRTGEWILVNGRVPDRDIFSFTKAGEPWFAWEWLWDVIFGWLHLNWGMAAVVLANSLVLALTFALLFRSARRASNHEFIAIAVTLVACGGSSLHWLARPHLFSLLFVVIFCWILERVREGRRRLLWWLPPLMALWTNLHGGFIAGVILILAYAAGELAAWLVEADEEQRRAALARSKPYLLTASAALAASMLNPYGYQLHLHIARYLRDPFLYRHISEYQAIDLQSSAAIYLELMLLAGGIAAWRSLRRREYVHGILYLAWGQAALYSARNIPIFLIVVAPNAARALAELAAELRTAPVRARIRRWAESFHDYTAEFARLDRVARWHPISVAAAALVAALLLAPNPPERFRAQYDPKRYPSRVIEALGEEALAYGVFTHDEWGDYLIYRLYPKGKVYVDGRSDFYGSRFDRAFLDLMQAKHGWERHLDDHDVHTALLPVDAPLAATMKLAPRWRVIYDDGMAIVFRRVEAPQASSIVSTDDGAGRGRRVTRSENLDQPETHSRRRRST